MDYRIAQNSGGEKLWQIMVISSFGKKNFGESEGELSFIKQKPIYRLWFLTFYKKLFNTDF